MFQCRRPRTFCALLLLVLAPACGDGEIPVDAAVDSDDAGGGQPDGGDDSDGSARTCDPDRTSIDFGPDPIEVGIYCDGVFACTSSQDTADAIERAAPEFTCAADVGCGGYLCGLSGAGAGDGGEVTEEDMAQICAVSLLLDDPESVVCHYVE